MIENKMIIDWYWYNEECSDNDDNELFTDICSIDEEIENFSEAEKMTEDALKKLVEKIENVIPITAIWNKSMNAIVYTY